MNQGKIVWLEIPVTNLERAIRFYEKVFQVSITKKKLTEHEFGIFEGNDMGIGGVLVKKSELTPGGGPMLFFHVFEMDLSIARAIESGGEVVRKKLLIKQNLEDGTTIIPNSLIDQNQGYWAELKDSEGNRIAFHSNY